MYYAMYIDVGQKKMRKSISTPEKDENVKENCEF